MRFKLNQIQRVFAYDFEGKRYDVGEKLGFIKTTIEMALQREDLKDEVYDFIKEILKGIHSKGNYSTQPFNSGVEYL